METLFALFSTGIWVAAARLMRSKNPVHSVFYLILVFLQASGLRFLRGLEFFGRIQLLVYVGALAVMFLFVVMLLHIPVTEILAQQRGSYPVAVLLSFSIRGLVLFLAVGPENVFGTLPLALSDTSVSFEGGVQWSTIRGAQGQRPALGVALYVHYPDLRILASLLLRVAMLGAVGLTLKKRLNSSTMDVFSVNVRGLENSVQTIQPLGVSKKSVGGRSKSPLNETGDRNWGPILNPIQNPLPAIHS